MSRLHDYDCPFCERSSSLDDNRIKFETVFLDRGQAEGPRMLCALLAVCANEKCNKFTLRVTLNEVEDGKNGFPKAGNTIQVWGLIPDSKAKIFPTYIPQQLRSDYEEACKIINLSPKASATLSRRCLQGAIMDFWGVKSARLYDQIEQIKDKVDPETWKAIDAVRQLGNIGAHMEEDVNLIIDVDPGEADLLVKLIEDLFNDWYITREKRRERTSAIVDAAQSKKRPKN